MLTNSINADYQSKQNFTGLKEGKSFRRIANKLILQLKEIPEGTFGYNVRTNGGTSIKDRLYSAIFDKAQKIGDEFVTTEDRRLHNQLKDLYKNYTESDDLINGLGGGQNFFVDHTINFKI
ncbi:MAG TPA: hypothetical protein PLG15_02810 [Candidatus Gastranaerophilaceae bacterium]|nr:hypothetical protein [Candidatus Gastranaerophilaceae bacterium]HPT41295.1 hypothetical protein [Candidatus Gastranaerophilaceae bacterium]